LFIYRTPPPLFSTLSLHDALPISRTDLLRPVRDDLSAHGRRAPEHRSDGDAGAADGHGAPAGDVPELGGRFGAAGDRRVEVLLRGDGTGPGPGGPGGRRRGGATCRG